MAKLPQAKITPRIKPAPTKTGLVVVTAYVLLNGNLYPAGWVNDTVRRPGGKWRTKCQLAGCTPPSDYCFLEEVVVTHSADV